MRISDGSSDVCSSDLDKGFVQGVGDREPQAYLFRRIRDGYRPVQHDVGFLVCKADVEEIIAVIGGRGIEGQVCAAEAVLIRGRQRAGEVLRQWYAKSISTGSSLHDTTKSIRRGEIDNGVVIFIELCKIGRANV